MKILTILTVRNEAAFLLEWLAHHRAVGVTDFVVFSNDCDDGTDDMLDHLDSVGQITHIRNDGPYDKGGIQFTALKQAAKLEIVQNADWILPLDIDEFVNVHTGDHTLPALIDALPEATAIALTWRLFGNADQVRYADTPVTTTFTRCAPVVMHWPWRAAMFKTLYKNDGIYRKPGVHRPRDPDKSRLNEARWFDGEGRALDGAFKTRRVFSDYGRANYGLAQINHYPLGAMQSYVLKADRGRAVHSDDVLGMDYWVERNFNTEIDTSIQAVATNTAKELDRLTSDPVLLDLHQRAVAWRHARFHTLMQQEPFRGLFGRLLMAAPSRVLSPKDAQMITRHAHIALKNADPLP
ncbi:MAG: glycosyltransferase family 2 protein [Sulfitobacter sp.]